MSQLETLGKAFGLYNFQLCILEYNMRWRQQLFSPSSSCKATIYLFIWTLSVIHGAFFMVLLLGENFWNLVLYQSHVLYPSSPKRIALNFACHTLYCTRFPSPQSHNDYMCVTEYKPTYTSPISHPNGKHNLHGMTKYSSQYLSSHSGKS